MVRGGDLHEEPAKEPEMELSEKEEGHKDGPGGRLRTPVVRGAT